MSHIEEVHQILSEIKKPIVGQNEKTSYLSPSTTTDKTIASILCLVFLAFALAIGIVSARPFHWPFTWDPLRDIGIAQTILDKTYPEDPILKDEINWYNPMTGFVLALFSKILNLSLPETCMRIGPFIQLLLPISMIFFAWNRWGPWAGFLILSYSLFARHPFLFPEWFYSCYSPWLLAPQWGKSFLFLTLLMFLIFIKKKKMIFAVFTGLCLGLGFLTHTAVLIEGGLFILFYAVVEMVQMYKNSQKSELKRLIIHIVVLFAVSLVVSIPYWLPILIRYQFIIYNPYPSLYVATALEWNNLPATLIKNANGFTVLGLISIIFVFIHWKSPHLRWLRVWTGVVLLLVFQQIMVQFLLSHGYVLPSFFPPHHTFMSVHALLGFWFVYGALQLSRGVINLIARWNANGWLQEGAYLFTLSLIFLICINTLVKPIPPIHEIYRGREENKLIYEVIKYDSAYNWVLNNTSHDNLFLCEEKCGIWVVLPSARKLIFISLLYMNPYVQFIPRADLSKRLWDTLEQRRYSDFFVMCCQNNVDYILLPKNDEKISILNTLTKILPCYQDHEVIIYKVKQK